MPIALNMLDPKLVSCSPVLVPVLGAFLGCWEGSARGRCCLCPIGSS